jgi:hypothetical protein
MFVIVTVHTGFDGRMPGVKGVGAMARYTRDGSVGRIGLHGHAGHAWRHG